LFYFKEAVSSLKDNAIEFIIMKWACLKVYLHSMVCFLYIVYSKSKKRRIYRAHHLRYL